jgi:putative peptidoglycan lipid II flippase
MLRSTATVGANTLVSRVLGLVRDIFFARLLGASAGADAFLVAFRIPNFLRRLFAEGAFSQAFVPVLSEYKETESLEQVRGLTANVAGVLGGVVFVVSVAGVVAAPVLVLVFAPGFLDQPHKYALTVEMVRIMFPYVFFISLTALAGGVLNTYGRFGVPAFTPVLLNLSLIASVIWLAPHFERPVLALAWGVLAAGVVQLVFQLPFLFRLRLLARPRVSRAHSGMRKIFKLMLPAVFGVSVSQINLLVDTLIASFLVTGSVTWLYLSDRMVEFPLGVFGIALATVILPNLSKEHAKGSKDVFSGTLDWALRLVLVVALPAALGLMVLAGPVLATLFQYGAYSPSDVEMASRSLMAYSVGLLAFVYIKILAPGFYARQDMKTPVRIGVVAMLSNIVLNVALVFPLAHAGLALATALSAIINAGLLLRGLRAQRVYVPLDGWKLLAFRVLVANLVMVGVLWLVRGDLVAWFEWGVFERAWRLTLIVLAGAGCYLAVLLLVGLRPRMLLRR